MFEINELLSIHQFKIIGVGAQRGVCLHSDGSILTTSEYWPTREQAQAVLDKFQPKHVWVNGDVFKNEFGTSMIFLDPLTGKEVRSISSRCAGTCGLNQLIAATFLFNIKDKL